MPTSAESASPEIVTVPYDRDAVATDTEYEDDSCDHQVAAVTEVQTLIYDNTYTDGRDHSVQYDRDTCR